MNTLNFDYDYLDECASLRDADSIYDETVTSAEDDQKNKYIYDIFGDTVNTAYRMKGLSSAMQVKVSPMTYELVKDDFEFVKQNPIEVKGKGQMETYNLDI